MRAKEPSRAVATRQRRVVDLWSWLPAFRAVAEREHVLQAARDLRVTPSSLSRAVGLVEDSVGKRLFDRVGRNLRLNHDGAALLAALRDGMRLIDDGVATVLSERFVGELHVACDGDQPVGLVWRAALRLQRDAPALHATVHDVARDDVVAQLLRGDLDLAVLGHPVTADRIRVEHVATIAYGIYCGKGHPLDGTRARAPSLESILRHPFVAPTPRPERSAGDLWPPFIERCVTLRVPALQAAIDACGSGAFLAVLPDAVVSAARPRSGLRRLPSDIIEPSKLYAVRRQPLDDLDRASALVAALVLEVRGAGLEPARVRSSVRSQTNGRRR